ncbi:transcription elongation factor GreB [Paraglaciecola hydrolytica]|uniref:Transcription elongation factor GreB n=1 Tax=Paraglaciecola hydrolytica TaxID=1799789 RepID=A0A136A4I2_9ALTE|nr:transcription elongation factor GreB [Paraglaciecola hydrolytica]KXI30152.1 transcription elongation factor GreB [Paraglaciecola hydrolytica]
MQPATKKTNYITRDGWEKLERELRFLWKDERPKVTQAVSEAAAMGDRSENAEYIYGKRRLREIDRRVRFLTKRMDELKVVYPSVQQEGKVFFGAWVELDDDLGNLLTYQLVGPDEFELRENKISIDSPMARALIGKQVDDEISVSTPSGIKSYFISAIYYKK